MLIEIPLRRAGGAPLYRQLYEALRSGILSGRLPAGTLLPSSRDLAGDLGVSRNTVTAAFDQLTVEGYLVSQVGSGTRVASTLGIRSGVWQSISGGQPHPPGRVSRLATLMLRTGDALPRADNPQGTFSLGLPAVDAFPDALWARLAGRQARHLRRDAMRRMDPAGQPALREALAGHYAAARGIRCDASQIVITRGTQQSLDLLARTLCDAGSVVAVEDPGFPGARGAFLASGARVRPVPVDAEGLRVDALAALGAGVRAVSVTPAHQFPTGVQMSLRRRLKLLAWARTQRSWILEDDYDSEFRFSGQPIATLRALDPRVIYLGTFSKTLLPTLRLAFIVLPPELREPVLAIRVQTDLCPPLLEQAVLADFVTGGHLARHLRQLRRIVRRRRTCLLEEAARELGGLLHLEEQETGLHLVGRLAGGIAAARATEEARREGVDVLPLSTFAVRTRVPEALVLGFGAAREPDIRSAVRRLRRALTRAAA